MSVWRQWHYRRVVARSILLVWWLSSSMLLCAATEIVNPATDPSDCHPAPCHGEDAGTSVDSCCSNVAQQASVGAKAKESIKPPVQFALIGEWIPPLAHAVREFISPILAAGFVLSYSPPPVFLWVCAFLK